ncbi:MAG: response regulator transcription factor [Proteobacteria bacterium]|nr:response regulator transcription factor [Pseudomonadota bacterium]
MSDAAHVLIVDDDRRIRALLASFLSGHGYRTTAVATAREARDHMRGLAYDLIILDVMMPGENGISFAADLRRGSNGVPILMLSALSDAGDRIKGLAAGSDDYLGKPFEPEELLLRVRNLLRRLESRQQGSMNVRFGEFIFVADTGELSRGGERIRLTSREKDMLKLLAHQAGKPVTRGALSASGLVESARAVDVQINRLRQKIESDPSNPVHLQTVRGEGYTLIADMAAGAA